MEKSPKTQEQAITVVVYYLQLVLELEEKITYNHVFTCFKHVARRVPKNLPQSIRDTAKRQGWVDTSERGTVKITTLGETIVDHDLSSSDSSEGLSTASG